MFWIYFQIRSFFDFRLVMCGYIDFYIVSTFYLYLEHFVFSVPSWIMVAVAEPVTLIYCPLHYTSSRIKINTDRETSQYVASGFL